VVVAVGVVVGCGVAVVGGSVIVFFGFVVFFLEIEETSFRIITKSLRISSDSLKQGPRFRDTLLCFTANSVSNSLEDGWEGVFGVEVLLVGTIESSYSYNKSS